MLEPPIKAPSIFEFSMIFFIFFDETDPPYRKLTF